SRHLFLNLKVKDEYNPKTGIRQEFYTNGKIRNECWKTYDKKTNCRRWDRNGQELKYTSTTE
ncbi:MAG: hypothetical protein ABUL44_01185, partial [Flavobacterium sp.]